MPPCDCGNGPGPIERGDASPHVLPPTCRRHASVSTAAAQGLRDRRVTSAGETRPVRRSLLQAAGMAPVHSGESSLLATEAGADRAGLPMLDLLDNRADGARYWAVTAINDRGRLADRTPLKVLGWNAGTPVTISPIPEHGIVRVHRTGPDAVTRQGFLRLPASVRYACRIFSWERLLVMANAANDVLVLYTPFAIDAMASDYHASTAPPDRT